MPLELTRHPRVAKQATTSHRLHLAVYRYNGVCLESRCEFTRPDVLFWPLLTAYQGLTYVRLHPTFHHFKLTKPSYNRYLAVAARVVRRSLKEDKRLQAERRGEMDLRFAKWEVSRALDQGQAERDIPRLAELAFRNV